MIDLAALVTPVRAFMGLCVLLVAGNLLIRLTNDERLQFTFNALALTFLAVAAGYLLAMNTTVTIMNLFSVNPFSLFCATVLTFALLLVSILAFDYAPRFGDFALMASFSLMGIYAVAFSTTLITIFVGMELMAIPTVFIVLLSRRSLEAATKLFIMGSISVALLSFAVVTLYGGADSFALAQTQQSDLLLFAVVLFIASLGFEASVFPFNVLIPDVYEGAPSYATAMLGGINKKVGFIALIQVLILVFITYKSAFMIIALLSVFTMFYGNVVAIMQRNFKRMLAYSSISQAGYMLIGIATASQAGITATLYQIFAHVFLFIGLFAIVSWLESRHRLEMDDMIGLNGENRFAAAALTIFMLSLIGLPFTTGFVGKFLIFLSAVNAGLVWLAIIGIVNTVISIYYYARPMIAMYTTKADAKEVKISGSVVAVVVICLAVTLLLGIYPQPLIQMVGNASAYLFHV